MIYSKTPPVDNPISGSAEDVLGRAIVAHDFARSIRELDPSDGIVVGVLGAWGHGKSSFVNLMKEEFSEDPEYPIIEFNPWLFSGSQQLTDAFFREIAAELRMKNRTKFGAIAEGLDKYGDVLSPIAIIPWFGAWWDRTFKAARVATTWLDNRKKGSRSFRTELSEALSTLPQPIVVVIDDIDRLTTAEIRDIFKLVRLTASFPNVIYLLAFDRARVEQALTEDGVPGRSYLEKIVQLSFDLPAIPGELLRSQIFEKLDMVLEGIEDLRFNQSAWSDVFFEIVEPLIGSLRDVTRLVLSARTTVRALGSQIETVDLMALETLRVFRPEVFEELHKLRLTLTDVSDSFGSRDTKRQQDQISHLLEVAGDDAENVRHLIRRVFPAALQFLENRRYGSDSSAIWKRDHRVAHLSFLELYFGRTAPSDLTTFTQTEKAYTFFANADDLGAYLDSVEPEKLEDLIGGLEAYQDQYPQDTVVPASTALLNRICRIPDRPSRSMFDVVRPDIVVGRVVLRLLQRIGDESQREGAVKEILSHLRSYSTQADFIRMVGYREHVGHKLISESAATALEADLASRVLADQSPVPNEEWDLLRTYSLIAEDTGDAFVPPRFTSPDEIRSLLKSARTVSRSQSFDSRAVHEEERLWWDDLIRVVGGEDQLIAAIAVLRKCDGDTSLVQLAGKYANGWRPRREAFPTELT
ncbi:KAP family P-loop NTPase fold protein [Microbacterium rhizosphaerae]|uniref:P-loop NTPase fold protein n=1 Tax=Microbacterium rhizosphaerae TaxID=1678237 RepID=A0ABZ0SR42_9MICO|nr:P-loop NTPase fold protein [Microbacterium rhizosphaerae]WPR89707.1 P-loop NTPase fold protein [Microbacterium rhizosphaerae]